MFVVNPLPVSYTHLDVYKRQLYICTMKLIIQGKKYDKRRRACAKAMRVNASRPEQENEALQDVEQSCYLGSIVDK